jgi:hypothetical protein
LIITYGHFAGARTKILKLRHFPNTGSGFCSNTRERQSPDWRVRNAIQENGVPGLLNQQGLVARTLVVRNISVRLEGGQGVHANACIPNRSLGILFDFWRI